MNKSDIQVRRSAFVCIMIGKTKIGIWEGIADE